MNKDPARFEVTNDHITLLRAAYVEWVDCQYGAPGIDCKRPYGNSNVTRDVAELLGWRLDARNEDGDIVLTPEQRSTAARLHAETETALQIFLHTGEMREGVYINHSLYDKDWRRVEGD